MTTDHHDAEDAPELTEELWDTAEVSIGGKVIRPATGYLGPGDMVRGRPPTMGRPRARADATSICRCLDPDVLERFRADGRGGRGGSMRR